MKRSHLLTLLLLPAACGGEPTAPANVRPPDSGYVAPADRLTLEAARALTPGAAEALGASRAGAAYDAPVAAGTTQRYVAPDGDDGADGSAAHPWRTVQRAADEAGPGTTVHVAAGTYAGGLEISQGGEDGAPVIFAGAPGAHLVGGHDADAVVRVTASHVVVQGFEIGPHQRAALADTYGVLVEPEGADVDDVAILGNVVHDIGPGVLEQQTCSYDGHGILAQAEGDRLTNLVIDGNELFHLYVGSSECLVVNGNVFGYRVAKNYVHDVNNIAIDVIGYEKNNDETPTGGLVADNVVLDASNYWPYCTRGNCAYPEGDESSDGIYVDGGAELVIEHNVVGRADHGIELNSENGELIRDVEVRFNAVFNSNYKHFTVGPSERVVEHDNVFFDEPSLADADLERCRG
ncbi:MAG: right-handed parallel beta-helix repeat-containing protein [Deltaproteobacteria bacterium]|nr:right-handed parallel beta-helix repeat-containing protein [Deltaproteobacteria bacterium]